MASRTLISGAAHPDVIQTIKTYCEGVDAAVEMIPVKDGATDLAALRAMLLPTDACVYLQQPNYYGVLEDAQSVAEATHSAGAKLIMGINPIAAAMLKTPRECGADIAVGEGQPLGMPLSFGGPYLGFMATATEHIRKLPGRMVGETTDAKGERCFVLTLQAREQHIRREKASSNICSNQALCAMTAAVYLAAMGPQGMRQVAQTCYDKAHYLAEQLGKLPGMALVHKSEFFHEFVTACPAEKTDILLAKLEAEGILGGLPVARGILWCVTEQNTKAQMDRACKIAKEVVSA